MHLRMLIAVGTASLLLAGCAGAKKDERATTLTPAPTTTQHATTAVSAADKAITVSVATTAPEPVTEPADTDSDAAKATAAILRLEDLPTGWTVRTQDSSDTEAEEPDCSERALVDVGVDMNRGNRQSWLAQADFTQSLFGPFLTVLIGAQGSAVTEGVFDVLPEALASCDGVADSDGSVQRYYPVDFPKIGDNTFAARIGVENAPLPVDAVLAIARDGDFIVVATHGVVGGPADVDFVFSALKTMLDRL